MSYVVGTMMVVFFLAGVGLFAAGLLRLIRNLRNRHRLRSAEGEIVRIESRQKFSNSDGGRATEYHYPEIRFRDQWNVEKTFLSEIGAGARAERYAVGDRIAVLYDPGGEIPPMIDSWEAVWGVHLVHMIVGPVFVFGALLIYWAFGDRILGR